MVILLEGLLHVASMLAHQLEGATLTCERKILGYMLEEQLGGVCPTPARPLHPGRGGGPSLPPPHGGFDVLV